MKCTKWIVVVALVTVGLMRVRQVRLEREVVRVTAVNEIVQAENNFLQLALQAGQLKDGETLVYNQRVSYRERVSGNGSTRILWAAAAAGQDYHGRGGAELHD